MTGPTVLFLGSAHLGNPNRDAFNVRFDDMLAPRRQREIRECVACLKRFALTRVALEIAAERDDILNTEYRRYRGGTCALPADEAYQLGFRVAAELGHERVHAIDWNEGRGDLGIPLAFAEMHQPELHAQIVAPARQVAEEEQARLAETSVRELLRRANDSDALRRSHRAYLALARIGQDRQYLGIDWVKGWYERNLIIFVNLTRIATTPADRILVIYGAGHIPLLTQFARDSGLYVVEAVASYL